MEKRFALSAEQMVPLIPAMGYCYATDRITVDGVGVGFMYREFPDKPNDSGWRFFSGDESQEYVDDAANTMLYDVNDIANYDRAIIPYLDTEPPCAFERLEDGGYIAVSTDFMDHDC